MDGQLKTLIELQSFDTRIVALEAEATKLPKEIDAVRARTADAKKTVDAAKTSLDGARKDTRAKEKDLEDNQVKRQKFEGQLYQSRIEEEILTLMERQERLAGEIKDAEGRLQTAESEGAGTEKTLRERLAAVETELGGVKSERAGVARGLPANVLADYDRLLRARAGLASVPVLKPNLCGACRMTVTPQRLQELRAQNALLACESCGRYLYWQP